MFAILTVARSLKTRLGRVPSSRPLLDGLFIEAELNAKMLASALLFSVLDSMFPRSRSGLLDVQERVQLEDAGFITLIRSSGFDGLNTDLVGVDQLT